MFWSGSVYPWIKKRIRRVSSSLHWHGGPQEAVGVHTITIHTNPAVEDHKTQWLESLKTSLLQSIINRLLAKRSCLTSCESFTVALNKPNSSWIQYISGKHLIAKRPNAYMHWLDKPRILTFCINISVTWHY